MQDLVAMNRRVFHNPLLSHFLKWLGIFSLWRALSYFIASEIALTKIRYRYRRYYAISWLLCNLLLRFSLLTLPIILILWPLLSPSKHPKIPFTTNSKNFIIAPTFYQQGQNNFILNANSAVILGTNHYQLTQGKLHFPVTQKTISANQMLFDHDNIDMSENVHYQQSSNNLNIHSATLNYNPLRKITSSYSPITGNIGDYRLSASGFSHSNLNNQLSLDSNTHFGNKILTLDAENGMNIDINQGMIRSDAIIYHHETGVIASANQLLGNFIQRNNQNQIKQLHFLKVFSYHDPNTDIIADESILSFVDGKAHHMIMKDNIRVIASKRTLTGQSAYLDYLGGKLEICGDAEIILQGGGRIYSPCAIVSFGDDSQLILGQKKRYPH